LAGSSGDAAVDISFLVEKEMIGAADAELLAVVDTAEEAVAVLHDFYQGIPPG